MHILAPNLRLSVLERLSFCLGECANLTTFILDIGESTGAEGYIELSDGVLQVTCHTVDLLTLVTGLHRRTLQTVWSIEYRSNDVTKTLFLDFSVLDTMSRWSMMKNIHSPNLVGIGYWGPEIWPHEYLLSPIEISVNWPGNSKQLGTRPIYTDFNGAN